MNQAGIKLAAFPTYFVHHQPNACSRINQSLVSWIWHFAHLQLKLAMMIWKAGIFKLLFDKKFNILTFFAFEFWRLLVFTTSLPTSAAVLNSNAGGIQLHGYTLIYSRTLVIANEQYWTGQRTNFINQLSTWIWLLIKY